MGLTVALLPGHYCVDSGSKCSQQCNMAVPIFSDILALFGTVGRNEYMCILLSHTVYGLKTL